jgi:hypothetical protein
LENKMNINHVIASLALLSAANLVQAAEVTAGASSLTRAQVRAETLRARAAGELDFNDTSFALAPATPMTRTRRESKDEVLQQRAAGAPAFNDVNYPVLPTSRSHLTRADVMSDTVSFYSAHPGMPDDLIAR